MANTELVWIEKNNKPFLKFIFQGHFSEDEAKPALQSWKKEFALKLKPAEKTNIIWDCINMTGFDPKVKSSWQQTLKELSPQIDGIWVISSSSIIRLAATTMGMLSQYSIKAVNNESEIS